MRRLLPTNRRAFRLGILGCLFSVGSASHGAFPAFSDSPSYHPELPPVVFSLDAAMRWALEHNPALAALREQHSVSAAVVVVSRSALRPTHSGASPRWGTSPP